MEVVSSSSSFLRVVGAALRYFLLGLVKSQAAHHRCERMSAQMGFQGLLAGILFEFPRPTLSTPSVWPRACTACSKGLALPLRIPGGALYGRPVGA